MTVSTPPHPFSDSLWQEVQQLLARLDGRQTLWLSGFLAAQGYAGDPVSADAAAKPDSAVKSKVLIAFGGETGNSEGLARRLAEQATARGVPVDVVDLAGVRVRQLSKREHLLVVCSTHGDGDPPEPVHAFYDALMDDNAPALPNLSYSVLALGDSSYDHFCVTGQQLDERLAALGARRLTERRDCDVDYEAPAGEWMIATLDSLPRVSASPHAGTASVALASKTSAPHRPAAHEYSKQQPLTVEVLENVCLSASHRHSPVHHLELAMEASGFDVSPGDAVGVLADNPPALVVAILDATGLSGEQPVTAGGDAMPLVQALREYCDLTVPGKRFLEAWASVSGSSELAAQVEADAKTQRQFLRSQQVRDLVTAFPGRPGAQDLVDTLRPLQPRLYDVANSLAETGDELHLTVKHYHYAFADREETGIASDYLLQLQPGDSLRIYPHRNARFHLPEDPAVPVILVADGTGIAPYRAFIQEISAGERSHRCWLAFSEQRFEEDFLYQLDWQAAHRNGLLERVDTAFYADHPDRTLGQVLLKGNQAMLHGRQAEPNGAPIENGQAPAEGGEQLLEWLRAGAHIYLCGDKDLLTQCEQELQVLFDEKAGPDLNWKQLNKAKRIHRNLY